MAEFGARLGFDCACRRSRWSTRCPPDRQERLEALWKRIEEDDAPLKPWPENDPIVEKYRRKGLID